MRLLIVSQDFPPETGGIQSYMGALARAIAPRCEALAVVAPGGDRERAFDADQPFPVHRVGIHSSWLVLPLLARLPGLAESHRASHVLYAQWLPALAGARLPRSIVQASIAHGRELLRNPAGPLGLALAAPVLRRLDAVLPNSRRTAALLPSGIDPACIHVVHPGVDLERFQPPGAPEVGALRGRLGIAAGTPVVTCLTRLVPRKGVDTLLESAAILKRRIPDLQVLIGGTGPDRPRLEQKIDELGIASTARFVGRVDDADLRAFLALGVFALLSRETSRDVEGFGMVLAEAQACGAPVVAARSGGMPEAVGAGAGRIVPPDAPDVAAAVLEELLLSDRREEMGLAGRHHAATLDWTSRAASIAAVLETARRPS